MGNGGEVERLDLDDYDRPIVVAFSGGKDSLACVLELLDRGVEPEEIELWHHDVDGEPGEADNFMDWPVTPAYCDAVAEALGIRIRHSWKVEGFEGEMLRDDELTNPTRWETDVDGEEYGESGGKHGKPSTRRKFPQVSGNLQTRWCSSYLKIDVGRKIFTNEPKFDEGTFLFVTGERAEESVQRAEYDEVELHDSSTKSGSRTIHQWRMVHKWSEEEVWDKIEEHGVNPHPAYKLGWNRLSCRTCIFGGADQWATVKEIAPHRFEQIAEYEEEFDTTIAREKSVRDLAEEGESYLPDEPELVDLACGEEYDAPVFVDDWEEPRGAYKEGSFGPS